MRKYILKLQELGLTTQTVSKNLQKEIKEFVDGENEFNDLQQQLSSMEQDDENYEEVSNQVEEYESLLEEADAELEAKIQKYADNKEEYDKRMASMREANAAKKAGKKAAAPAAPAAAPAKVQVQTPNPTPAAPKEPNPPVVILNPNDPAAKEGKKDGIGDWVLWGGLGLLGLVVGVNFFKNRN